MKKNCISLLFLLSIMLPSLAREKETFVEGCFRYELDNDSLVRIAGVLEDSLHSPCFADSTMVIPGTVVHDGRTYRVWYTKKNSFNGLSGIKHLIVGEGVECMNDNTFNECEDLESVWLSSTVELVGENVFSFCPKLKSIVVDERNESLDSRNNCNAVIETDLGVLVRGCDGTAIPQGVTSIGELAFFGCAYLDSLVIPEGVKELYPECFLLCPSLKYVSLPKSLEIIEGGVFQDCSALESVFIPENVSKIGNGIFYGCGRLRSVAVDKNNKTYDSRHDCNAIVETATSKIVAGCGSSVILDGVKEIGEMAFCGTSLQQIVIPGSVVRIGEHAFLGCKFCTSISVDNSNTVYYSPEGCNAIIERASDCLVQSCMSTSIPSSVKALGSHAFTGISLPSVFVIPDGVSIIHESAFSYCRTLRWVLLPKSSVRIEWSAFNGCSGLVAVSLPDNIGLIDESAFRHTPYEAKFKELLSHLE